MRTVDFVFIAAMATVKKRKIDSECHVLINSGHMTVSWLITIIKLCASICSETVSVLKEFNLQRHYDTKHKSKFDI